ERYHLYLQSEYRTETENFRTGPKDNWLDVEGIGKLEGWKPNDVLINHVAFGRPLRARNGSSTTRWPRAFVVGTIRRKNKDERYMAAWVRGTFKSAFRDFDLDEDLKNRRRSCGLNEPGVPLRWNEPVIEISDDEEEEEF